MLFFFGAVDAMRREWQQVQARLGKHFNALRAMEVIAFVDALQGRFNLRRFLFGAVAE
jgi:hypothetical protein